MTDLDILAARLDEINHLPLPLSAIHIDTLIACHRAQRAYKAAGGKPTKPSLDISALLKSMVPDPVTPPAPSPKRFFLKKLPS